MRRASRRVKRGSTLRLCGLSLIWSVIGTAPGPRMSAEDSVEATAGSRGIRSPVDAATLAPLRKSRRENPSPGWFGEIFFLAIVSSSIDQHKYDRRPLSGAPRCLAQGSSTCFVSVQSRRGGLYHWRGFGTSEEFEPFETSYYAAWTHEPSVQRIAALARLTLAIGAECISCAGLC